MTATPSKPQRASRQQIRVWAWIAGTLSFFAPFAVFGLSPRPAASAAPVAPNPRSARPPKRPVVVVVTKKIVIEAASSSSSSYTTSSSAPINYVYAPAPAAAAPAPVTVSCGTHPC